MFRRVFCRVGGFALIVMGGLALPSLVVQFNSWEWFRVPIDADFIPHAFPWVVYPVLVYLFLVIGAGLWLIRLGNNSWRR